MAVHHDTRISRFFSPIWLVLFGVLLTLPLHADCGAFAANETHINEAPQNLFCATGQADADGFIAYPNIHQAGHLAFGPYAQNWSAGSARATFRLLIDDHTANNEVVATLDIFSNVTGTTLARRTLHRKDFHVANTYQDFCLWFEMRPSDTHLQLETRVW